ncbi:MAG TPA: class I SAM-dependent methyltransferase [Miltoncostaeaceae bacterium]|nr:class I SAM-dependent methyltransferase [Miltoncostaeaceae bacterium]
MTGDRLDEVQAYYDNLADRLVAVESRNWHLQSRMALNLETIDRYVIPSPSAEETAGPEPIGNGSPRVLDVGCGTGFLLEQLAGRGYRGVGVDLSPESVEHANRRLAEIGAADRLTAVVGSAYEPPEGPFDLIALTDVLEHLEDPRRCLAALRAQLAPDGLLVISTPNRRSLPGARRWLSEHGVPGIRLNLAPIDRWQTWTDLEGHAASAGLVPVSRRGIFFRPGGRVGSQIGRLYRYAPVRRAEVRLSRTPAGRFGFYICLGFRAI